MRILLPLLLLPALASAQERWAIEGNVGLAMSGDSAYTDRLRDFGYAPADSLATPLHFSLGGAYRLSPHLELAEIGRASCRERV